MMKKIVIFATALLSALSFSVAALAATDIDPDKNGVVLNKTLSPRAADGSYTITLDAFVTGSTVQTVTTVTEPVDLILVLDVSGSMDNVLSVSQGSQVSYSSLDKNKTYILVRDGNTYYLKYKNNGNNKYWAIVSSYSTEAKNGTQYSSKTGDTIYSIASTTSKMQALQSAVCSFIETVSANAIADNVDHRVSIVKYAGDSYYNDGTATTDEHDTKNSSGHNRSEVVKRLTSVKSATNVTALETAVNGLTAAGATAADYGMNLAKLLLDEIPTTRESNKVVVMFTDGEPNHYSGFWGNVAANVVTTSNTIKNTYNAKVFTIGVFGSSSTAVDKYMTYTSSNYPSATATSSGSGSSSTVTYNAGSANTDGVSYYQKSDGSDLTSIFESIASASTSGAASRTLDASTTTVIDKMSTNFVLPEGVSPSDIEVKVYSVDDYTEEGGYTWKEFSATGKYSSRNYQASDISVTVDETTQEVKVTGFDYSLADEWSADNTKLNSAGNWVGPRKIGGVNYYYGNKLQIKFKVNLDPDYEGGYDVPSNDTSSGIYVKNAETGNDEPVEFFTVPTEDFPSICIIKEGLAAGESAVFTATSANGTSFQVVLTQKYANKAYLPCYAVLKGIEGNTTWTVTETDWSWTYTTEPTSKSITQNLVSLQTAGTTKAEIAAGTDLVSYEVTMGKYLNLTGTYSNNTYGIVYRQDKNGVIQTPDDATDGAVVAIYRFTNTKMATPTGLPARGEAYAHNRFKGGTAASGGTETGGNEEEDI